MLVERKRLPNLIDAKLSEEISQSIYQADTRQIADGISKVYEGSTDFRCEGFTQYKHDGYIARSFTISKNGANSLKIAYHFGEKARSEIGIKRRIRKPEHISSISLWIRGDNSNVPILAEISGDGKKIVLGKHKINWAGWKKISFENKKSSEGTNKGFKYISIYLKYDPKIDRISCYNGAVYIDDIEIIYKAMDNANLAFDFETRKLRSQDSGWWNQVSQHPPFYYLTASILYILFSKKDILTIVYIIRLLSILYGLVTIYYAYLISKNLFPRSRFLYLGIPSFISFSGSFTYYTSVINNDTLLNVLFIAFIYYIIKKIKYPDKLSYTIVIASISGLGLLTKMTFIPGVIAIPFVWLSISKSDFKHRYFKDIIIIFSIIVAISGWWFYRNYRTYGSIFTVATDVKEDTRLFTISDRLSSKEIIKHSDVRDWYLYSWLMASKDKRVQVFYLIIYFISALGWICLIAGYNRSDRTALKKTIRNYSFPLLMILLVYIAVFSYIIIGSAISCGIIRGIHGRYFHPIIVLLSIPIIAGINNLPNFKFKNHSVIILYILFFLIGIYDLFKTLVTYYL